VESLCRRGLALERISRGRDTTFRDILQYLDSLPADFDVKRQGQIEDECTSLVESSVGLLPPPALRSPRSDGSAASLAGTVEELSSPRCSTVVGSCVSLLADTILPGAEDLAPTEILAPSLPKALFQVRGNLHNSFKVFKGSCNHPHPFEAHRQGFANLRNRHLH
jgi:hypothetical protein